MLALWLERSTKLSDSQVQLLTTLVLSPKPYVDLPNTENHGP